MKIVPLSEQESARSGFTHVVNLKVANGDLTAPAGLSVITLPIGTGVFRSAFDFKTIWSGGTIASPTLQVSAGGTSIISATTPTSATFIGSNTVGLNASAASTVTVTLGGPGSGATAGEANLYLQIYDLTQGRSTFP